MAESPAASSDEAADLLKAATHPQARVRYLLQRGGNVDLFIVSYAYVLGYLGVATHGAGDSWLVRIVLRVLGGAVVLTYLRRRRNLGSRIEWPTWVAAGVVFAATLAIDLTVTHHRSDFTTLVFGAGLLVPAFVYRRAWFWIIAGTLAIVGISGVTGAPSAVSIPALAVYVLIVGYFGRDQFRTHSGGTA
jgi:hypothetical protein